MLDRDGPSRSEPSATWPSTLAPAMTRSRRAAFRRRREAGPDGDLAPPPGGVRDAHLPGPRRGRLQRHPAPGDHYIELRTDLSNLEQVLETMASDRERRRITEAAYRDVVASGTYGYQRFVAEVEGPIPERAGEAGRAMGLKGGSHRRRPGPWAKVALALRPRPRLSSFVVRKLPDPVVDFLRRRIYGTAPGNGEAARTRSEEDRHGLPPRRRAGQQDLQARGPARQARLRILSSRTSPGSSRRSPALRAGLVAAAGSALAPAGEGSPPAAPAGSSGWPLPPAWLPSCQIGSRPAEARRGHPARGRGADRAGQAARDERGRAYRALPADLYYLHFPQPVPRRQPQGQRRGVYIYDAHDSYFEVDQDPRPVQDAHDPEDVLADRAPVRLGGRPGFRDRQRGGGGAARAAAQAPPARCPTATTRQPGPGGGARRARCRGSPWTPSAGLGGQREGRHDLRADARCAGAVARARGDCLRRRGLRGGRDQRAIGGARPPARLGRADQGRRFIRGADAAPILYLPFTDNYRFALPNGGVLHAIARGTADPLSAAGRDPEAGRGAFAGAAPDPRDPASIAEAVRRAHRRSRPRRPPAQERGAGPRRAELERGGGRGGGAVSFRPSGRAGTVERR